MSRIEYLKARVSQASTEELRAMAELDLAIYLLRAGHIQSAVAIYFRHRDLEAQRSSAKVTLRLMLFEGLRAFFDDQDFNGAIDRVRRSLYLSASLGYNDLISLSAAWFSHICFNRCEYGEMAQGLRFVSKYADEDQFEAVTRAGLVIADSLCAIQDYEASRRWYELVRSRIIKGGDQISLAALMHNRSVIGLTNCLFEKICLGRLSRDATLYLSEIDSAENYERYIGAQSVLYPYAISKYRREMIRDDYACALLRLQELISNTSALIGSAAHSLVIVDSAYCMLMIGNLNDALSVINQLGSVEFASYSADDRSIAWSLIARVLDAAGQVEESEIYRKKSAGSAKEYIEEVETLRSTISGCAVDSEHIRLKLSGI